MFKRCYDQIVIAQVFVIAVALNFIIASPSNAQEVSRVGEDVRPHANWARFRGPSGMGNATSQLLPLNWTADDNIAWKVDLPGSGTSSPIVWQDHIYITAYSGYLVPGQPRGELSKLERHLIALDATTGNEVWRQSVPAKLPEEENIRDHGYAANTPVADAEGIYAFFGKSGIIAYDHSGQRRWQADVGDKTHSWGSGTSLVIYDGMLFVNASVESESLIALNLNTGQRLWQIDGIRESWNTPLVCQTTAGRQELVLARFGEVLGIDPENGKLLWNCRNGIGWYIVPSVIVADDVVYSLGGRSGTTGVAVRLGGNGDVTNSHRLWATSDGTNVPSPLYRAGYLYWANHDGGIVYCVEAVSGKVVYRERIDRMGQVYASPILSGNRIYYTDRSGKTYVVAAEPTFRLLASNDLSDGSNFDASPAVVGDQLLIRSGKRLYCVE